MAKTILVASGKGGVGKSTISAGLAKVLAAKGKKILLIDCDAGLASLEIMLNVKESIIYNWFDVYKKDCSPEDALQHISGNLDLLPAPRKIIPDCVPECIREIREYYNGNYDYIFIDAPAGLSEGLERGALAADACFVIATGDEVSVSGAHALEETVRSLGVMNTRLIINRYDIKAVKKKKFLTIDDIINKTSVRLIGIIPEEKEIMYSSVTGKYNSKSKSSQAFERIADRLEGKNVKLAISLLK